MSEINWDDAPKSATHFDVVDRVFCNIGGYWWGNPDFFDFQEFEHEDWGTDIYIARPFIAPVFTREMFDNNELPPIGSYFIDIDNSISMKVESVAHHNGNVVYMHSRGVYESANHNDCYPIDIRTDKEIAIDNQMKKFTKGEDSYARAALNEAYDDWGIGK